MQSFVLIVKKPTGSDSFEWYVHPSLFATSNEAFKTGEKYVTDTNAIGYRYFGFPSPSFGFAAWAEMFGGGNVGGYDSGGFRTSSVSESAATRWHRQRGCCDGSDPSACFARMRAEAQAKEDAAKEERKRIAKEKRTLARDEFYGTD